MTRTAVAVIGILSLLLLGAGCSNPATGKPEAEVSEPAPETAPAAEGQRFVISDDSTVGFTGSKVTGSHEGGFNSFEGEIVVVVGKPEASSVNVTIDTDSLWSDNDRLTGHLKSPDFFDVETFPTATFTSTSIEWAEAEGNYTVTGNLDLHGITKSISFPATITVEDGAVTAQAEFFIKRFDFEIVYPGKPDDLIRDEVVIRLDLKATPAAA
jgi:polyisoprenoid-binding protein YceI